MLASVWIARVDDPRFEVTLYRYIVAHFRDRLIRPYNFERLHAVTQTRALFVGPNTLCDYSLWCKFAGRITFILYIERKVQWLCLPVYI